MPKFEILTKEEAQNKARFSGERGKIMAMYMFFIEQLKDGKAGRLKPGEGETVHAVRRRLGKAAKLLGKDLVIKKINDEVYFWPNVQVNPEPKRRRRASKNGVTNAQK